MEHARQDEAGGSHGELTRSGATTTRFRTTAWDVISGAPAPASAQGQMRPRSPVFSFRRGHALPHRATTLVRWSGPFGRAV